MENEKIEKDLNEFLEKDSDQEEKTENSCPSKKPGITEKVIIDKTLITEDGRELLREITYKRD
jgi:hypothetical protein